MGWVRRLSPRAEKTIRLVAVCSLAAVLGIVAVARRRPGPVASPQREGVSRALVSSA